MPKDQISTSEWMLQNRETRAALVRTFHVPRTGFAQTVTDATGVSNFITDGHNHKDLAVITFEDLLTYLGEAKPEDNIHTLFLKVVEKIENPQPISVEVLVPKVEEKVEEPKVIDSETRQPLKEDPGPDGYKCELCSYATANSRALHMHRIAKHKNR